MGRQTQTGDATDELDEEPTPGDLLCGEEAIYEVTGRTGDKWDVELAATLRTSRADEMTLRDRAGRKPAMWVDCFTVVDGESVRSLTVETGDRIHYEAATLEREPATAEITVRDDSSVALDCDGELVPDEYQSTLALKCSLVAGNHDLLNE